VICDVHAHCLPAAVAELLREHPLPGRYPRPGGSGPPMSDSPGDLEARLALMDEAGVEVQVLSLSPLPFADDEELTVRLVRAANDALAAVVARHPDRLRAYAELPLPYVDAALRELERCRAELGLTAVNLLASCGTTSAVDAGLDELYQELDRSGSIVCFHPRVSGLCSALVNDHGLESSIGPLFEDSLLVVQMIRRAFLHAFPHLEVIVPHLGGILPICLQRLDNQLLQRFPDLPEPPSATARRIWYDTLSHGSVAALRSAWEAFGAERLVTGSDYPVMLAFDGYAANIDDIRHAGLPEADVERILHRNAPGLFGLGPA